MRKSNKGITLVALIITVIVLLTLAVVTISAVTDGGIIGHAKNASERWMGQYYEGEMVNGAIQKETSILDYYAGYINNDGEKLKCDVIYDGTYSKIKVNFTGDGDNEKKYFVEYVGEYGTESRYLDYEENYKLYSTEIIIHNNNIKELPIKITTIDGTVVEEKNVICGYDSIFKCYFNNDDKTAFIEGFKEKNILSDGTIVDDNNVEIETLDLPGQIIIGDNTYTVTSIHFNSNSNLENDQIKTINIPASITNIGEVFQNYSALTTVNINSTDYNIEKEAFANTPWINKLYNDNNGLAIYNGKLINIQDTSITSIDIPNNVTSMASEIFSECSTLENVTGIPSSGIDNVEIVYAFSGNLGNNDLSFKYGSCPWYTKDLVDSNGIVTYKNVLVAIYKTSNPEIEIPKNINAIVDFAILTLTGAGNIIINIPNSVTRIDNSAFHMYSIFGTYVSTINIDRAPNSIPGAPWGDLKTTVNWTGSN